MNLIKKLLIGFGAMVALVLLMSLGGLVEVRDLNVIHEDDFLANWWRIKQSRLMGLYVRCPISKPASSASARVCISYFLRSSSKFRQRGELPGFRARHRRCLTRRSAAGLRVASWFLHFSGSPIGGEKQPGPRDSMTRTRYARVLLQ
jgi:hypothetical protein